MQHQARRKDEGHHLVRWLSGSLKRKHAHGKVLSHGNYASVIENGQKKPAETTGMRNKNVNLMDRTQKWMGSVGCFGQIENIRRKPYITVQIFSGH